jgi:Tfp pilus assembly protein PilX
MENNHLIFILSMFIVLTLITVSYFHHLDMKLQIDLLKERPIQVI